MELAVEDGTLVALVMAERAEVHTDAADDNIMLTAFKYGEIFEGRIQKIISSSKVKKPKSNV